MRFLGIDPSMTATGLVVLGDSGEVLVTRCYRVDPEKQSNPWLTIRRLRSLALQHGIGPLESTELVVAIEQPILRYNGALLRASLFGVLCEAFASVLEVAPTRLKSFATGRGTASKGVMSLAAQRDFSFHAHDDNVVDAFWLAQFARCLHEFHTGRGDESAWAKWQVAAVRRQVLGRGTRGRKSRSRGVPGLSAARRRRQVQDV